MRDETERLDRAAQSAMRGDRFRLFMSDPDVIAFFDAYERDHVERMLSVAPTDHESRQGEAMLINAMREFRAFIKAAIAAGDRSAETLRKETRK